MWKSHCSPREQSQRWVNYTQDETNLEKKSNWCTSENSVSVNKTTVQHFISAVSVGARRHPTSVSRSCHSKQEKQHLKLTPTLGSTLRTGIASSEGFSERQTRQWETAAAAMNRRSRTSRRDRGYFCFFGGRGEFNAGDGRILGSPPFGPLVGSERREEEEEGSSVGN